MTVGSIGIAAGAGVVLLVYLRHAIAFDRAITRQGRKYRNGKQEQDSQRSTDSGGPEIVWGREGYEIRKLPRGRQGDGQFRD
jgi:hypothetical protein